MIALLTLLACEGGGTDAPEPILEGFVETSDATADVAIYKAFGFNIDGAGLWYLTSGGEATCASVVDFLSTPGTDPTGIWGAGNCNITLSMSDYDGVERIFDQSEAFLTGFWSLQCALGDGEFAFEDRGQDEGYFWSGLQWIGDPDEFSTTVRGDGAGTPYEITVDMTDFVGNYPDVIDSIPALGSVSGTFEAKQCADLYQVEAFPK